MASPTVPARAGVGRNIKAKRFTPEVYKRPFIRLLQAKCFPLENRKRRIPRTRLGEALRSGKWQRGSASFGLFSAKHFAISSNARHNSVPDSPAVAFPLEPEEKHRSRSASFPKAFQWRSASLRKNEKVRRRPPVLKEALPHPGACISRRSFSPWAQREALPVGQSNRSAGLREHHWVEARRPGKPFSDGRLVQSKRFPSPAHSAEIAPERFAGPARIGRFFPGPI